MRKDYKIVKVEYNSGKIPVYKLNHAKSQVDHYRKCDNEKATKTIIKY